MENGRELASIKSKATNSVIASYEYDSSGLRISKTTPAETVYYAYDENANLIFEKHANYTLAFHYDGNGIRTHFDHITSSAINTYYYRYNLQGDVIALLNSAGTIVADYEYTPYGREVYTPNAIGSLNPFRYKGYYFDSETNYYYLQSRYYDPEICRFINADDPDYLDASGTLLGLNLYTYCENDPINNVDMLGYLLKRIPIQKKTPKTYISAAPKPTNKSRGMNAIAKSKLWDKSYSVYVKYTAGTGKNYDCFVYRTPAKKFLWVTYYNEVRYYVLTKTKKQWQTYCEKYFGWYDDLVLGIGYLTESTAIDMLFNSNPYISLGATIAAQLLTRMPKEMKYIYSFINYKDKNSKIISIPFGKRMYSYNTLSKKYSMFSETWLWW